VLDKYKKTKSKEEIKMGISWQTLVVLSLFFVLFFVMFLRWSRKRYERKKAAVLKFVPKE